MSAPALTRPALRYRTTLASGPADVEAVQRLRHDVFGLECGALLDPRGSQLGLDVDEWDEHSAHLLVREVATDLVVGTYRLLPPERAQALGRGYSDSEFDLSRHAALRSTTVEAGRSCVHPDHRNGAVITQLWAGVARYVLSGGYTHLAGCASISLADGGSTAAGVWDVVRERHLAPAGLRVVPRRPFDVEAPVRPATLTWPPLVRAYLKVGAKVCGRPGHDPEFGTADLYVLLDMADLDPRILRHLLGSQR